jgi:serine/threonine protein kinase
MIGEVINDYKILSKLGEGAFGSVYKVENKAKEMYHT